MSSKAVFNNNCEHFLVTDGDTGEISCANCGMVISDKVIEYSSENFGQTSEEYQNNSRTGQKISLKMADMGLFTVIQAQDKDSAGKSISTDNKRTFYRLRMWDRNSRHSITNQSFVSAFTLLDGIRSKLGLPDHVVEKSAYIYRKAYQKKLLPGRSNHVILCAVVYMACRITDTPRTITDIALTGGVQKKVIQRAYRFLARELNTYSKSYSPTEFIERIASEINMSKKTKNQAREILEKGQKQGVTEGKHPMAMAAAALYLSAQLNQEKMSQSKIANASRISTVTIRNRVKELEKAIKK